MANQIRGLMKTFGLIVPRSMGGKFEAHVRSLLADDAGLARIILPLVEAWRSLRVRAAELGRQLLAAARRRQQCQVLMSIPGVGGDHGNCLPDGCRGPGQLRAVTFGGSLAGAHHPTLPVGRGRL